MPVFATPQQHPLSIVPPFERIDVHNLIAGGTTVQWVMRKGFCEPEPYTFQLQYAEADVPGANWTNVGSPVTDAYVATDPTRRNSGKELTAHYRIRLTTSLNNTYVSPPVGAMGVLSPREWGYAQEIIRKERLNMRRSAIPGLLYKAKRAGTPCPDCLDPDLGQVTDSKCLTCFGLRIDGGYYDPVEVYADLQPSGHDLKRSFQTGPMDEPWVHTARMLASPYPAALDVWVNKESDERHIIRKITNVSELRGVPIVVNVELRLAPFDDIVYALDRPD